MRKIAMIGNSHIEPVWVWLQIEGVMEAKSAFMYALDRMNKFPVQELDIHFSTTLVFLDKLIKCLKAEA